MTRALFLAAFMAMGGIDGVSSQEPRPIVDDEARAVIVAALESFATPQWLEVNHQRRTLVLSGETNGWQASPPGDARRSVPESKGARRIEFPEDVIRRLSARSGGRVQICSKLDRDLNSLCGIEGPWLWLIPSQPFAAGHEARLALTVMWLESPPLSDGSPPEADRAHASYDIFLVRTGRAWTVTRIQLAGVG